MSVSEALRHAGWLLRRQRRDRLGRLRGRSTATRPPASACRGVDGVLVPGGFGGRGIEGKIRAARVAREQQIPYLGICLGHADRGRRVRPPRGRHGRRELDRVRHRDRMAGHRPAARAEGGLRPRRHDAPGRRPGEAPRRHAGPRHLRRGRHLRAPPPPLRGVDQPAQAAGARRPGRVGHVAGRAPGRDDRAAPTTRSSSPRSSTRSSSRARSARRRCSASSCEPRWTALSRCTRRATCAADARRAQHRVETGLGGRAPAAQRALRGAVRDPERLRARRRGRRPRGGRAACAGPGGLAGRGRRTRPAPSAATCSRACRAAASGPCCCARTSTPSRTATSRSSRSWSTAAGRTPTRRSSAPTTRPRSR